MSSEYPVYPEPCILLSACFFSRNHVATVEKLVWLVGSNFNPTNLPILASNYLLHPITTRGTFIGVTVEMVKVVVCRTLKVDISELLGRQLLGKYRYRWLKIVSAPNSNLYLFFKRNASRFFKKRRKMILGLHCVFLMWLFFARALQIYVCSCITSSNF